MLFRLLRSVEQKKRVEKAKRGPSRTWNFSFFRPNSICPPPVVVGGVVCAFHTPTSTRINACLSLLHARAVALRQRARLDQVPRRCEAAGSSPSVAQH